MIEKLFLFALSFSNIALFWIIKLPHLFAIVIFVKHKLWRYPAPIESGFLLFAIFLMTGSSLLAPNVQFFADGMALILCTFVYITSFTLVKYKFTSTVLIKTVFNSVFYCSVLALSFYVFKWLLSFDIREVLGLRREIKAEYFGVLRNAGLSTEPGSFAYYYLSISSFVALYVVKNRTAITLAKLFVILASFILTFSAGAIGIFVIAFIVTSFYSIRLITLKTIFVWILIAFFLGFIYKIINLDFLLPIVGKLTLSADYASSSIRLQTYLWGLEQLAPDKVFGSGPGYTSYFFEHSLFNWFLTFTVEYGYVVLSAILLFFIGVFLRIRKIPMQIRRFYFFSYISIILLLNIVGVFHSVFYWFVLGAIGGIAGGRDV